MQGRTLLVIDDNDAVRTALDVLLTLEGARVEQARHARAKASNALARGGIDLVIQDMNFQREATSGARGHRAVSRDPRRAAATCRSCC